MNGCVSFHRSNETLFMTLSWSLKDEPVKIKMDNTFRGTQKAFMNAVIHKGFLVPLYTFYKNTTPSSDIFLLKILHTHWLSEIESLNHMHAAAHDFFELLLCLHAFHADFNVNRLGKLGYHLHESV